MIINLNWMWNLQSPCNVLTLTKNRRAHTCSWVDRWMTSWLQQRAHKCPTYDVGKGLLNKALPTYCMCKAY